MSLFNDEQYIYMNKVWSPYPTMDRVRSPSLMVDIKRSPYLMLDKDNELITNDEQSKESSPH